MTRDDVVKLAREAGLNDYSIMGSNLEIMERFAALVAQQEREACAMVCDEWNTAITDKLANAIRARDNSTVRQSLTVAEAVSAERESCAKVCEHYGMALDYGGNQYFRSHECLQAAAAIRARGAK